MLIPDIKPGELLWGYIRRLAFLNGFSQMGEAVRYLNDWMHADYESPAELMAGVLNLPIEDLLRLHTLAPLHPSLEKVPTSPDERQRRSQSRDMIACAPPLNAIRICRQCVSEDVAFWGVSYIRRDHQTPGRWCCEKHACKLVAGSANYFQSPDDLLEAESRTAPGALFNEIVDSKGIIARYLDIMDAWLTGDLPLHAERLPMYLRTFSVRENCSECPPIKPVSLAEKALAELPHEWLDDVFDWRPRRGLKIRLAILNDMLAEKRTYAAAVKHYALAFALLSESTANVIDFLRRPLIEMPAREVSKAKRKHVRSSVAGDDRVVALRMPTHPCQVHALAWMQAAGMPDLETLPNAAARAFLDFCTGTPLPDAVSKYGVEIASIEPLLRSASMCIAEIVAAGAAMQLTSPAPSPITPAARTTPRNCRSGARGPRTLPSSPDPRCATP